MDVFFEIHQNLTRESPGGDACTRQALAMLPALSRPRILDVGCGPGAQTLELARGTDGTITAIDLHQPFLDRLRAAADAAGLADRIRCLNQTMFEMPFPEAAFDVVWAEGSIYIMGFERGLKEWRRLIRPGGFLVVNEVVWLRPEPPPELREFWHGEYPSMLALEDALELVPRSGYELLGHFPLPEDAWWEGYYRPVEARIDALRPVYRDDPEALAALENERREIEIYRQYHEWYGFEFFAMRRGAGPG